MRKSSSKSPSPALNSSGSMAEIGASHNATVTTTFFGKVGYRHRVTITFVGAKNLPLSDGAPAIVKWRRGLVLKGRAKSPPTPVSKGSVDWNLPVNFTITLFKESGTGKYEEKKLHVAVGEERKIKSSTVGEVEMNFAEFADASGPQHRTYTLSKASKNPPITLNIVVNDENMGVAKEGDNDEDEEEEIGSSAAAASPPPVSIPTIDNSEEDDLQKKLEEMTKERDELAEAFKELEQKDVENTDTISNLRKELDSSAKKIKALKDDLHDSHKEARQQKSSERDNQHETEELNEQIEKLKQKVANLEEQLEQSRSAAAQTEKRLSAAVEESSKSGDRIPELERQITELQKDKAALAEKVHSKKDRSHNLKKKIAELEAALKEAQKELEELEDRCEELLETTKKAKRLETELKEEKAASEAAANSFKEQIAQLSAEVKKLTAALDEEKAVNRVQAQSGNQSESQTQEIMVENQRLKSRLSSTEDELQQTTQKERDLATKVSALEKELQTVKTSSEEMSNKLEKSNLHTEELEHREHDNTKKITALEDQLTTVKKSAEEEAEQLKKRVVELEQSLEKASSLSHQTLSQHEEQLAVEIKNLKSARDQAEAEVRKVKGKIGDLENEVRDLKTALDNERTLKEGSDRVAGKVHDLEVQISELEKENRRLQDAQEEEHQKAKEASQIRNENSLIYHAVEGWLKPTEDHSPIKSMASLAVTWSIVQSIHSISKESLSTHPTSTCTHFICPVETLPDGGPSYLHKFCHLLSSQYTHILKRTKKVLKPLILPSILEQSLPVFSKTEKRPATKNSGTIISALTELMQYSSLTLPKPVYVQFFCQLYYWINAVVFNHIVTHPDICTCSTGFQVKLSLSQLEDLASTNSFKEARSFLRHCQQAAGVLMVDPQVLDNAISSSIFGVLSPSQVATLVVHFRPDSNFPGLEVPKEVVTKMEALVTTESVILDPEQLKMPETCGFCS
ncbi:laminin, alpha 3/5 [Pelomyxa schiedti]|nr:laminin, alpha 3/5 [Pelomyxa schiedti]